MQKHTWAFMEVLEQLLQPWGCFNTLSCNRGDSGCVFSPWRKNGLGATASGLEPLSDFVSLDGWAVAKSLHLS